MRHSPVDETIALIENGNVSEVSLDYDLDYTDEGRTGVEVCLWLYESGFRCPVIHCHSANPYGASEIAYMWRVLEGRETPDKRRLNAMFKRRGGRKLLSKVMR